LSDPNQPIIGITGSEEHTDFLAAGASFVMVKVRRPTHPLNPWSKSHAVNYCLTARPLSSRTLNCAIFLPTPVQPINRKMLSDALAKACVAPAEGVPPSQEAVPVAPAAPAVAAGAKDGNGDGDGHVVRAAETPHTRTQTKS
jgi:hypothetical protein